MELKSLNCKNCGNPLHESEGQLKCSVCGSVFSIESSFATKKIDQMHRSLENMQDSIETDKRALEEFQRVKEQAEIEAEQQKKARMDAFRRETRRNASRAATRAMIFTITIPMAIIAIMFSIAGIKNKTKKPKATTTTTAAKNFRITASDLKAYPEFFSSLTEKVIESEKDRGSVYESTDDTLFIWNLSADPYVEEYFLVTANDRNWLYMLVVLPMEGFDNGPNPLENRTMDGYEMAYIEDVIIGEDGTITYYEDKIRTAGSDDYSYFWHADFDKEKLIEDTVGKLEDDPKYDCRVFRFTV